MSNAMVLKGRERSTEVAAAATTELDNEMRAAQAIAGAKNLVPSDYRANPGAVLLISQWARTRDIDPLTAMQTVSFIQGKPVVDATMQRAMAERAGYDVRVVETTPEQATVEIWRNGEQRGSETYTMADARTAGLTGKDNWKKNPRNMLVARATTNAIRFHASSVVLGTYSPDELDEAESDNVLSIVQPEQPEVDTEPPAPEIHDAELVEDDILLASADYIKKLAKEHNKRQSDVIQFAQTINTELGSIDAIANSGEETVGKVLAFIEGTES